MKRVTLFGLIALLFILTNSAAAQSDRYTNWTELGDMISPVGFPTLFEDPRQTTELRPFFMYHKTKLEDFGTAEGEVYQLQGRFRLMDDLSLIVTKLGYANVDPGNDFGVLNGDGATNASVGLKYTVDHTDTRVTSAGLRYEIPWGDDDIGQGEGNGFINPFLTTGFTRCGFNFIAQGGLNTRLQDEDSSFYDIHMHADYKIGDFYPLLEVNLIHWYNDGERVLSFNEGGDLFDFGATEAAGSNLLAGGVGARYRFAKNVDGGLIYNFPIDRGDGSKFMDWRITADLIYRFDLYRDTRDERSRS